MIEQAQKLTLSTRRAWQLQLILFVSDRVTRKALADSVVAEVVVETDING
ncbi:MAG: hypothetical protein AAFR26_24650 [Cyanobacteria bacterium J06626_4]